MLTSKTFVKKTKRGGVLKVVREHYLRDDIWCGSRLCHTCEHEKPSLDDNPSVNLSELCAFPHYLVPDTNVVLHQIDVLEDHAIKNVVILQTVLEEVRHKHSPIYKRLKDIVSNIDRQFYAFTNEHHKETYIERQPGESANDRNDRAIRLAAKWYQNHLSSQRNCETVKIVLLTNDRENLEKARKDDLAAFTISEYVKSIKSQPHLADRLAKTLEVRNRTCLEGDKPPVYPEHLSLSQLQAGIKAGRFLQGAFMASRENFLEGHVSVEEQDEMILIQGRNYLNRAVNGDTVAIELLPKTQWTAPSSVVLVDNTVDPEGGDGEEPADSQILSESKEEERRPTARVVGIIKRKWRQYCGILLPSPMKEATRHLFVPAENKIPRIKIETRQADILSSQRIVVAIDSWPRNSRYPLGHFVRALGPIGDKDTENEVLLLEHDVPHQDFSEQVLRCLPKLPWLITEEDLKKRQDLRHLTICSVDPPGCTDIDDALHCRELDDGNYEVGVHIADVSHFIRPGTALDKEAAIRGTTVYLVDKRIDMVPELLSSNLCSLRSDGDR